MKNYLPDNLIYLEDNYLTYKNQKSASDNLLIKASNNLGYQINKISRDPYGAIILNSDLLGVTSHSHNKIICCVGKKDHYRGIGIDLQKICPFNKNISKKILNKNEIFENELDLLKIFSIKEAIYKAYYLAFNERLSWKSVSIELIEESFNTIYNNQSLSGKCIVKDDFIYSYCLI